MKENEAPEKIHISIVPNSLNSYTYITCGKDFPNAVEYIRTDAFIEKAARYLNCRLYNRVEVVNFGTVLESIMSKGEFVDEFRKYMKGE